MTLTLCCSQNGRRSARSVKSGRMSLMGSRATLLAQGDDVTPDDALTEEELEQECVRQLGKGEFVLLRIVS